MEGGIQSPRRDELLEGIIRAFLVENQEVIAVQRGRSDGTQAHNYVSGSALYYKVRADGFETYQANINLDICTNPQR